MWELEHMLVSRFSIHIDFFCRSYVGLQVCRARPFPAEPLCQLWGCILKCQSEHSLAFRGSHLQFVVIAKVLVADGQGVLGD